MRKQDWIVETDSFHAEIKYKSEDIGKIYKDNNAFKIVHCMNLFDELIEALEAHIDTLGELAYSGMTEKYRSLLKRAKEPKSVLIDFNAEEYRKRYPDS